jgi:hypothetical protein
MYTPSVVIGRDGNLKIDNMRYSGNINSTYSDVGGNQNSSISTFETLECPFALTS